MSEALRLARKARDLGETPIGAVVERDGAIVARAWNQVETLKDATAHAEMLALTQAQAAKGDWRLNDCALYVTREPCLMCAGALVRCRVKRVVFACSDEQRGACGGRFHALELPFLNHFCQAVPGEGVDTRLREEAAELLRDFFRVARRRKRLLRNGEAPG